MRPPICEVCDADAREQAGSDTEGFALVTCAPTPESEAWRARVEAEHLVGHPPDVGWFCARHADAARALAPDHPLAEVIARVRGRDAAAIAGVRAGDAAAIAGVRAGDAAVGIGAVLALHARLVVLLPRLAENAGITPADIAARTERRWSPIDGAVAPECPFVDTTIHSSPGTPSVTLRLEHAWWNEAEQAKAFVSCLVHGTQGRDLAVSASADSAGGASAGAASGASPSAAGGASAGAASGASAGVAPPKVTIEGDAPAWLREALGPSASA